jgi:hypothetical protein
MTEHSYVKYSIVSDERHNFFVSSPSIVLPIFVTATYFSGSSFLILKYNCQTFFSVI